MIGTKADMTKIATRAGFPKQRRSSLAEDGMSGLVALASVVFGLHFFLAIMYNSQIVKFFGGNIFEYVNRSLYIISGISLILGIFFGEFFATSISLLIFVYMSTMTIVGSYNMNIGISNYLFLVYTVLTSAPVVAYLFRVGRGNTVGAIIKVILMVYFAMYVYFSMTVSDGGVRTASGGGFIMASDGRGSRIAIDAAATATGYFLGFTALLACRFSVSNISILILAILTIYLSSSRQFIFLIYFISVVYLFFGGRKVLGKRLLWLFILVAVAMIVDAAVGDNLYSYFSFDSSGYARLQELETIKNSFWQNALFGKGFFNPMANNPDVGVDYSGIVFWNDMGIYGIIYATGFFGIFVFVVQSALAIKSLPVFIRAGLDKPLASGLGLASVTIGIFGVSAPNLWTSGFELLTLIVAAMAVSRSVARDSNGMKSPLQAGTKDNSVVSNEMPE